MRFVFTAIFLLAIPAAVGAQEATDAVEDAPPAPVQLEQSVTTDRTGTPATTPAEGLTPERTAESEAAPAESAVVQDPGSRQWWWIVGAVVVGGLIVALVL